MDTIPNAASSPSVTRALAGLLARDSELAEELIAYTGGLITVAVDTVPDFTRWTWALHEAADGHAENCYSCSGGRLEARNTICGVPVCVRKPLGNAA